jgi:hypothetical protein
MRKMRIVAAGTVALWLSASAGSAMAHAFGGHVRPAKSNHARSKFGRHTHSGRYVLQVTSASDDATAATTAGTLRWAITQNDALTQAQRQAHPRTIEIEPAAGIISIQSELPNLLGPLTVAGAGNRNSSPTVGLSGAAFMNPFQVAGSACPSTDGNLPATVVGNSDPPLAGPALNGPNARGIYDPLLQVDNPTVTGTAPTNYGTSDGTAYGIPNGAFGVPADYNFGTEPNGDVTIDHLVLENACIGILSLRSHNNTFEHNRIYNDVGAAGIIVTGDAGDSTGSGTVGVSVENTVQYNEFVDNGDHMEYTRGTSDSLVKGNVFIEDPDPVGGPTDTPNTPGLLQAGDLPSQTLEFAAANDDDNTVIDNRMLGGMSDGIQNGGSGLVVENNYITGEAYAIDLDASGATYEHNTITGNHAGLVGTPQDDTILANSIYGQGAPLSMCNAGGVCSTSATYAADILGIGPATGVIAEPGCTATEQNYPQLTGASTNPNGSVTVTGTLSCSASGTFEIQVFANAVRSPSGSGEGETLVGDVTTTTDATGSGQFTLRIPPWRAFALTTDEPFLSSTATDTATGASSIFSPTLTLFP